MRLFYLIAGAFALAFVVLVMRWDFGISGRSSSLSNWAINQIDSDLAYFKVTKFSKEDIESEYKHLSKDEDSSIMRFQIVDGKLYSNYNKTSDKALSKAHADFHKFFSSLIEDYDFKENVDFIVSRNGELKVSGLLKVPIIVPMKREDDESSKYTILAPDHHIISEWGGLYHDVISANDKFDWDRKIEKAFWRGKSSSTDVSSEDWSNAPRIKLVELSTNHPSLIDAKLTKFVQSKGVGLEDISSKFPIAMAVSQSDHVKHKMQVYVEGGESSISADLWRLLSNTVTLKQKTNRVRWFDSILKENEHYIYVEPDMSDTLEKINWVLANDSAAQKIAHASTEIIKREITPDHIYLYWKHILTEYAKLQGF